MFAVELRAAVDAARSDARLVELSQAVWQGHAAGALNDDDAQAISELVHARRTTLRGPQMALRGGSSDSPRRSSIFPPKRLQQRPDRARARARHRHHARARWMPDHLADQFTDGELAALAVIAEEHAERGACDLPMAKIAALAGVSEGTARNGLRAARALALIAIEHRPRPGQPNLTNVVRIVSPAWLAWIKRRPAAWHRHRGGGCKDFKPMQKTRDTPPYSPNNTAQRNRRKGCRGEGSSG